MDRNVVMRRERERGFTLLELMVAVIIVSVASMIAIPILEDTTAKSRRNALLADGRVLYDAFMTYYVDEGEFPAEAGAGAFDKTTLAPLSTEGYFPIASAFLGKMEENRVLLYLAPDIGTRNSEYIAIMRAAQDNDMVIVVAHTGIVHAAGQFLDGVYLITNGELKEAGDLS